MKHKGIGAAAFIVDNDGRVLLVKHTYVKLNWELPGGGAEANESPAQTAIREVREETGLIVVARHMTGYYYAPDNDSIHFVFRCDRLDDSAVPTPDTSEISECRFWSTTDLPRPISDWTIRRIEDAVSGCDFGLPVEIGPRVWLK
jgi:8-oxo-dGTP pyrophosphatase MutT (NUDIX family)